MRYATVSGPILVGPSEHPFERQIGKRSRKLLMNKIFTRRSKISHPHPTDIAQEQSHQRTSAPLGRAWSGLGYRVPPYDHATKSRFAMRGTLPPATTTPSARADDGGRYAKPVAGEAS